MKKQKAIQKPRLGLGFPVILVLVLVLSDPFWVIGFLSPLSLSRRERKKQTNKQIERERSRDSRLLQAARAVCFYRYFFYRRFIYSV